MNARFLRLAISAIVIMICRAARGAGPFGLPDVDELKHAAPVIGHYVVEVKHWTCKYEWTEQRRIGSTIIYRVTFPAQEKCSRSKRPEYFDLFYDSKLHKVIEMTPAK